MKRMVRRIVARSRYNDLGDPMRCGPDLVSERAPENLKYEVSKQLADRGDLTSDLERKLYPSDSSADIVVSLKHKMTLSDGSPWSGSDTFNISVRFTSHAQQRMDYRCIQPEDVYNLVTDTFRKMESAWLTKNVKDYAKIFKYFHKGLSGKEKIKGSSKGDVIQYVIGPVASPIHEDLIKTKRGNITVEVPSSNRFSVNLVSIMGGNRKRITPEDLEKERCKHFLEEKGYTLTRKGSFSARMARALRPSVILMQPDGSMLRSDGSGWVDKFNYGLMIDMNMDEDVVAQALGSSGDLKKEVSALLKPHLARKMKSELYDKWDARDFNAYNANMSEIFKGFDLVVDGVTFTFSSLSRKDLGTIEDYGTSILTPPVMGGKPNLYYQVDVSSANEKSLKDVKVDREVQDCIDTLSRDYIITK